MQDLPVGPVEPAGSGHGKVITYVPLESRSEWESEGLNVPQILGVLRRHLWLIVGISLLTLGAVAFLVSRETTLYQARALIRLKSPGGALAQALGSRTGESETGMDPMLSAIMVLESRAVLGDVVDREGLRLFSQSNEAPAGFVQDVRINLPPEQHLNLEIAFGKNALTARSRDKRVQALYGTPIEVEGVRFVVPARRPAPVSLVVVPREAAIDYIERLIDANVRIAQGRTRTDGIDIMFTSTDPRISVQVVNAVAEVYREHNASDARAEATHRREFLEQQLGENDSVLRIAQSELGGLRGRTQTYSAQQRFALEQSNLRSVEMEREELAANRRMLESLLQGLLQSQDAGSSANMSALLAAPGLAGNQVVAQLHSQLMQYQTARDEAITGSWAKAPSHPEVQRYNTLIASIEQKLIEAVQSQLSSIDAQIAMLGGLGARAAAAMGQLPSAETEEMHLMDQVETLRQIGDQLRTAYQTARIEEGVETGHVEIVYLANRAFPVDTNSSTKLMLGLVLGLVLGSAASFVREKMDNSIHHPAELDKLLGIPSLAVIPRITSPSRMGVLKRLISGKNGKDNPASSGAESFVHRLDSEAYRVLRTNLLFSPSVEILKTLIVTSAGPKEGKTTTAVNLAVAYAHQGLRVSLLDCDLRRPALAKAFGTSGNGEYGDLANVIMNDQGVEGALCPSGIEGLDVLATTTSAPNPTELLGGASMERILDELAERYDVVILDTPPVLLAADAAVLGSRVDGVLLVVRAGSTDRAAAQQALEQLAAVGARVVGGVLNDPDSAIHRYGRHYAYSHAGYPQAS
jgi:succinoglycan biosynthesis transport protein ExoP